jgi:cysteine desulfurase/selenocysteine lyase
MEDGCAGILEAEAHLEEVRTQVARAIGADGDEIAFLRSTSDGALVVANGIAWREGDEIVLSDTEFGANVYPYLHLRDRGVRVRFIRSPQRMTVEALEEFCGARTRLVAVSYVCFADGYRHDLAALGAWCRRRGILFAVDAMQGFGQLPLSVGAWQMDFCYFGAAKWLLAPQGLSVLFVRHPLEEALRPALCSWRSVCDPMNFLDYAQPLARGARRMEGGTINHPALAGLARSLELLTTATLPAVESHILALTDRLIRGARERGIEVKSDLTPQNRSGIVLLGCPTSKLPLIAQRAARRRVGVTIRDNGVRVSPHGYNTPDDVDAVLELFDDD